MSKWSLSNNYASVKYSLAKRMSGVCRCFKSKLQLDNWTLENILVGCLANQTFLRARCEKQSFIK